MSMWDAHTSVVLSLTRGPMCVQMLCTVPFECVELLHVITVKVNDCQQRISTTFAVELLYKGHLV